MEAAAILSRGSPFHVTHVVTVGAPTAQVHGFPTGSHVLSLENRGDVVPLMDGHDNPDSPQQVTVQFDDHETSVVANHAIGHYVNGAAAAEASTDASVREQLASLRSHGFLGGSAAGHQPGPPDHPLTHVASRRARSLLEPRRNVSAGPGRSRRAGPGCGTPPSGPPPRRDQRRSRRCPSGGGARG